jgi:hypothetical protein
MAVLFFDTSALLKRYVQEAGSSWVREALAVPGGRIYVSRIARLECISALSRRLLGSPPQPDLFAVARRQIEQDWERRWQVVELNLNLIGEAEELAERHRIRAYDALHLACAKHVYETASRVGAEPYSFVASDFELNEAARREGLHVIDPAELR